MLRHPARPGTRSIVPCAALACLLGALLGACAASSNGDDDDANPAGAAGSGNVGATSSSQGGTGATGATSNTGATGADGGAGATGGSAPVVPTCQLACGTVSQCSTGSLPYDADNYACSDGYCHYLGCNSDTECQSLGSYVCRDLGAGFPYCTMACGEPANCSTGTIAYDADNYDCVDGVCRYTGCNSDTECQSLGSYVCRDLGAGVPYCTMACGEPADCATTSIAYDADNYDCIDGVCHYTGCHSDPECQSLGSYVCR